MKQVHKRIRYRVPTIVPSNTFSSRVRVSNHQNLGEAIVGESYGTSHTSALQKKYEIGEDNRAKFPLRVGTNIFLSEFDTCQLLNFIST